MRHNDFVAYLSCPISVSSSALKKYEEALKQLDITVKVWERGSPYNYIPVIQTCDAFVLILPEQKFKINLQELPIGCTGELRTARQFNRRVFIAYTTALNSTICFYDVNYGLTVIEGASGTSNSLKHYIQGIKSTTQIVQNPCSEIISSGVEFTEGTFDKRLLLF